jgi:hypothetical protein
MPLSAPRYGQVALVKKYARWCEEMLLVALPAHPDVINLYLQHRLHEDGVDTSTTELDVQAISAWHISAQVAFHNSSLPNPAKTAALRFEMKSFAKKLKKPVSATEKWSVAELSAMVAACPKDNAYGLHDRVCLSALSLGLLRRGAASAIRLVRTDPADPLSFDLDSSDISLHTHPRLGRYFKLAIHTDKTAVPGRPRYVYLPELTACGINFVSDMILYLTTYAVPDGPLFASPTGKNGVGFKPTMYKNWDTLVKRCYKRVYPTGTKKIASHSCRKSSIQAIFSSGVHESFIGDLAGWLSVKSTVLKYYASLSVEHAIVIIASLGDVASASLTTTSFSTRP